MPVIRNQELMRTLGNDGGSGGGAMPTAGVDIAIALGVISRAGQDILRFDGGGGMLSEYPATNAGLTAALAASGAGDIVLIPAVSIAGAHVVPADVTLVGTGQGSVLTGAVTVTGYLLNVMCTVDILGAGVYYAFNAAGDFLVSPNFLLGGNVTDDPKQKQTIFSGGPYEADAAIHYYEKAIGVTSVVLTYIATGASADPDHVYLLDGDIATCDAMPDGTPGPWLYCTIDPAQLPPGFVISGIEVEMYLRQNCLGSAKGMDRDIVFLDAGNNAVSDDKSSGAYHDCNYAWRTYGSNIDDWNATFSTADVNAGNIKLGCRWYRNPGGILWLWMQIDYIKITFYGPVSLEYVAGLDITEGTWAVEPGDTLTGAGLQFHGDTGVLEIPALAPNPPLDVSSAIMVSNLNADMVDGLHAVNLLGPWFNVRDYGAIGNGVVDDTAAINLTIAAIVAVGGGVLHFPYGIYLTNGGHILIVPITVWGDGCSSYFDEDVNSTTVTRIITPTQNSLFKVGSWGCNFHGFTARCTHAAPLSGAGIWVPAYGDLIRYSDLNIQSFSSNIYIEDGAHWSMENVYVYEPAGYGIYFKHTDFGGDFGDFTMNNVSIVSGDRNGAAALYIESGGGCKITNLKINGWYNSPPTGTAFLKGIHINVATTIQSGIVQISNSSIENVTEDGILIQTAAPGTTTWKYISLSNIEFGMWTSGAINPYPIRVVSGTIGDIEWLNIANCIFATSVAEAQYCITLDGVNHVRVVNCLNQNFAGFVSQVNCTDVSVLEETKLDDWSTPDDNTDLDATAAYHGLLPKLSGDAGDVLLGDGTWGAAGGGGHTIQDEGVALPAEPNLNFVGDGVVVTDDPGNTATVVTIGQGIGEYQYVRKLIGEVVLSGTQAVITFDNIPQTYDHLEIMLQARSDKAGAVYDDVMIEVNDDVTDADYETSHHSWDGTVHQVYTGAGRWLSGVPAANALAGSKGNSRIWIDGYRDGFNKILSCHYARGETTSKVHGGTVDLEWQSTAAITKLELSLYAGDDFVAGSRFQLFGLVNKTTLVGQDTAYVGTVLKAVTVPAGGQASIDLTGIPTGYDELIVQIYGKTEKVANLYDGINLSLNNDTTNANYETEEAYGGGVNTIADFSSSSRKVSGFSGQNGNVSSAQIHILGYDTALYKTVFCSSSTDYTGTDTYIEMISTTWRNAAVVNQITLTTVSGSDWAEGTVVKIIGYKNTLIGGIHSTVRITAGPYTVLANDEIIFCDTDGGTFEVDLPAGVEGKWYKVINCGTGANDVTLDPDGAEQIYGGGAGVALTLTDGQKADLHFNATEGWW